MEVSILSADSSLLAELAREPPEKGGTANNWDVEGPERTPGAVEGWWQLAVDVGVIAAPVSVFCNLLASWIWTAIERRRADGKAAPATFSELVVILRSDGRTAEVRIEKPDRELAITAIVAALKHVHPEL